MAAFAAVFAAASCTATAPASRAQSAQLMPSEQAGLYYVVEAGASEPASLAALIDDQGQLVDLVTGAAVFGTFSE